MDPTPDVDRRVALIARGRGLFVVCWSAFLAASVATMFCFAFFDPQAIAAGELPEWWHSRRFAYAAGFFFFWSIGVLAAALAWFLASRPTQQP